MDTKQALDVLNQGVNVAVGAGAFKNSRDVAVLAQSIEVLANYFQAQEEEMTMKGVDVTKSK